MGWYIRDGHRVRKNKHEVKILGDYLLKKMKYFPPWKCKKKKQQKNKQTNRIQVKTWGFPSLGMNSQPQNILYRLLLIKTWFKG